MIFLIVLSLLTLLGYSRLFWFCNVIDFFRPQYTVLSFGAFIWFAYNGAYIEACLSFLLIALNSVRFSCFLWPERQEKREHPLKREIMSVNVHEKNKDIDYLQDIIEVSQPDILLLMEVSDENYQGLLSIINQYPYSIKAPMRDEFEMIFLSKYEIIEADVTRHSRAQSPLIHAKVKMHETLYQFFGSHPKPSLSKAWHQDRLDYFKQVIEHLKNTTLPVIVLGDFNSVLWEPHFQEFLKRSNLKSTLDNQGYKMTWPVYFKPMGIPMDHILVSKDVSYKDVVVGPYCGSDHYPISINTLNS